jgi:hypothetical protein
MIRPYRLFLWLAIAPVVLFAHGDVPAASEEPTAWGRPAFLGMVALDLAQTHNIRRQPARYHETQPALGEHPDAGAINRYFIASTALLYGFCEWTPDWLIGERETCFRAMAAGRAFVVIRNRYLGIGARF